MLPQLSLVKLSFVDPTFLPFLFQSTFEFGVIRLELIIFQMFWTL